MGKDVIIALDFDSREKTLAFLDLFQDEKPFVNERRRRAALRAGRGDQRSTQDSHDAGRRAGSLRGALLQKQLAPGRLTLEGYLRCTVYYQGEEGWYRNVP